MKGPDSNQCSTCASMQKSVDFLARNYKSSAVLSIVSLVALVSSVTLATWVGGSPTSQWFEYLIACVMAVFLLSSFAAMIISTVAVVRNRSQLVDWGMFLIFIWFVPYLSIAFYLGFVALRGRSLSRVG